MNKRFISLASLVFLALLSLILAFAYTKNKQTTADSNNETITSAKEESREPENKPEAEEPEKELLDLARLEFPILMYHHIRDYNFEKDTIGTNLSVSPKKFAEQLDFIQAKGYATATFSDILNNTLPAKPIILTFDDGYENFYLNAFPELQKRKMKAVVFLISNSIGQGSYMSAQEIGEINNFGVEIGSHTLTHPDLTKLDTIKTQSEIVDSKNDLEKKLGVTIDVFCYPGGHYNDQTVKIVEDSGYKFAVTTKSGITNFGTPFELKRERVNSDTNISGYLR